MTLCETLKCIQDLFESDNSSIKIKLCFSYFEKNSGKMKLVYEVGYVYNLTRFILCYFSS